MKHQLLRTTNKKVYGSYIKEKTKTSLRRLTYSLAREYLIWLRKMNSLDQSKGDSAKIKQTDNDRRSRRNDQEQVQKAAIIPGGNHWRRMATSY